MIDINKTCEKASKYYKKRGKRKKFDELQNSVIATKDPEYIFLFAWKVKVEGADLDKLTKAIIATHNAEYIFDFANCVEGADIDALTDEIIKIGSAYYIYSIARINPAKVDILTKEICKPHVAIAEYIFYFACDVKTANKYDLARAIKLTNDKVWIAKFKEKIGEEYFTAGDIKPQNEDHTKKSKTEGNISSLDDDNLDAGNKDENNVTV